MNKSKLKVKGKPMASMTNQLMNHLIKPQETYFDWLPAEMIDIIYRFKHKSEMKDVFTELTTSRTHVYSEFRHIIMYRHHLIIYELSRFNMNLDYKSLSLSCYMNKEVAKDGETWWAICGYLYGPDDDAKYRRKHEKYRLEKSKILRVLKNLPEKRTNELNSFRKQRALLQSDKSLRWSKTQMNTLDRHIRKTEQILENYKNPLSVSEFFEFGRTSYRIKCGETFFLC